MSEKRVNLNNGWRSSKFIPKIPHTRDTMKKKNAPEYSHAEAVCIMPALKLERQEGLDFQLNLPWIEAEMIN